MNSGAKEVCGNKSAKEPRFSFKKTKSEDSYLQYLRASYGKEMRFLWIAGAIMFGVGMVFIVYVIFTPNDNIPPGRRMLWNAGFLTILPAYPLLLYLMANAVFLFLFDWKRAWKAPLFGQKFIKTGEKYGSAPKEVWPIQKEHNHSKNAYYFDERLGCKERIPVNAELYSNQLKVKQRGKKEDEYYLLKDAYKVFWGAGLVVIRFKTKEAPKDIVLDVKGLSKKEKKQLNTFLNKALPLWCRKYTKFLRLPFGRRHLAFLRHPLYDRWDLRFPILHSKEDVVAFKTPREIFDEMGNNAS